MFHHFGKFRLSVFALPALISLVCLWILPIHAQDARATIGGRVTDPQRAVVPGATVTVVSYDTNVARTTMTNDSGMWQIESLLPGKYRFTVTASGFRTEERLGLTLEAADMKQFDVQLVLGSSAQTVIVTAETPLIDTTAATSGTVVTQAELENLPSQSHVPTLFATLAPGVVERDQGTNVVRAWSNDGASQFVANGGRDDTPSNNFQLDGMPNTKNGGDIAFIPPMDSVQEFRIQTNAYDASIGRQAGATFNMETKSGGKQYHGDLYEYNQNSFLNANRFEFNRSGLPTPPIHFNQFGGVFGGPVRLPKLYNGRERTFFFVAFDKTINTNPLPSTISLPTKLERTGDFSQSYTTQAGQRYSLQIYNPFQIDSKGNRSQFTGSVISPATLLSPIAQAILKYVPLPNAPGDGTSTDSNDFVSSATRHDVYPVLVVRVDQNWNNSQHSFVTINWDHLSEILGNDFNDIATGNNQIRITKRVGLDHVWTMGSNRVLSMHYTLDRWENPQFNLGAGFDSTKLGLPSSIVSQFPKASFPYIHGIFGGYYFGTSDAGNNNFDTDQTWGASLTQMFRKHSFRMGGEYWVLQHAVGNLGKAGGEFDFGNTWTKQNALTSAGTGVGSAFADFLLGLPNGGNLPVNATAFYSQHYIAGYFQDDWRVTTNLTLNLGLRWDLEQPVTERFNRLTDRFDPTVINPISSSAQAAYANILATNSTNAGVQTLLQDLPSSAFKLTGAQLFAGVNGTPRGATNADYHEWQPRVGFAWKLNPRTVLRGGFGRFTQASFTNGGQNGFSRTTSFVASQDSNFTPYDTLANPFHSGILQPTGSSLGPLTNLGQSVNWDDSNLNRMYSLEYSLHVQEQLGSWLVELGYSHNKTYDIPWTWNGNEPSFTLWQQLQAAQFDSTGRPVDILPWNQLVPNPFYQLAGVSASSSIYSSKTIKVNQLLNPIPLLGNMDNSRPTGKNGFDSMQAKIEHRYANGLSFITAFTWSKLFEDTAFLGPQIAGPKIEHKLGGEDRPFVLTLTGVWDIPFGRGRQWGGTLSRPLNTLVGGWELSGNYQANSGIPVVFSTDSFYSRKSAALSSSQRTLSRWFDTSQFYPFPSKNTNISTYPSWTGVQNLPGASYVPTSTDIKNGLDNGVYQDFANYIRNYPTRWGNIRQDGVYEMAVGLYKDFAFNESTRLQLRFDAFNALNHPRFGAPNANPGDSNFGVVSAQQVNQPRTIELGGKFYF